ncbi:MAG: MBL fold metallo-hydrolase [Hydrococcus sp. C42_A2020_068]|nr:MBL fold metallo-hydrolase [Hydrococcus sp. C42_A2020_068]
MSKRRSAPADLQDGLSCFPYGVGHGNEGVCLLVTMGAHRILLDCGLADIQPLQTEVKSPADLVLCSHAHADHARGLLALHEAFPELPIYASEVTIRLLPLNWQDRPPQEIRQFCQALKWRSPVELFDDLTVELFPAGHLPGAAAIFLTYKTPKRAYKLFYTGDFSLSNFQLVEGLSIEALRGLAPDVLIIEGSYGTTRHPHRRQQEKHLMERIYQALVSGQNVLLPVPTLGLGQEILKLLRSHHQFTGRDLDIWVDGSVAQACDIYLELLPQFPIAVQNFAKHQPLFWDDRICPRMRRFPSQKLPIFGQAPCIVLTDNAANLEDYCYSGSGSWLILVPERPGGSSATDAPQIATLKKSRQIAVESYFLAEHSDGRNTTQLVHNLRPQHVIFIHGSPLYLADLTSLEELQNRYQLHSPAAGTFVELPIGDKFMQPAAPSPTVYEGELNETGTSVTITLPDAITENPRWSNFSDTGLVEARWQGEELVLRGLSQRELLSQSSEVRRLEDVDCCGTCRYWRSQRCWNQASPLYGFKVTPEGYCPVFEPL